MRMQAPCPADQAGTALGQLAFTEVSPHFLLFDYAPRLPISYNLVSDFSWQKGMAWAGYGHLLHHEGGHRSRSQVPQPQGGLAGGLALKSAVIWLQGTEIHLRLSSKDTQNCKTS